MVDIISFIGTVNKEQICSVNKEQIPSVNKEQIALSQMADPIEELNAVLMTCGINDAGMHANIIAREGFTQLEDLRVLETDTDITEMAKRMASRMQAKGRVLLGTVIIKRLQTLIWWVRDHQKRGLALEAANFNVAIMNEAAEMKNLRRELSDKEPSTSDLGSR
jgi:3-methyladenine DNA glycosylase Tag